MSLPQTLAPAAPLGSSSPQNGDDELRGIKQFLADVFGLPVSPTDIHTKVMNVTEEGCVALAIRKTEYYTSGPQTLTIDHEFVVLNSASAMTLNLPQASTVCTANGGKVYFILNIGSGTVTISPYSGNTTEITSLASGDGCILLCLNNGPKWWSIRVSNANTALSAASATTAATANRLTDGTNNIKTKILDIGDWNMDSLDYVSVTHGLTYANIRSVSVLIRNDGDTYKYPPDYVGPSGSSGTIEVTSTLVRIYRVVSGFFDSVNFDSTSYNRGWVVITYVE